MLNAGRGEVLKAYFLENGDRYFKIFHYSRSFLNYLDFRYFFVRRRPPLAVMKGEIKILLWTTYTKGSGVSNGGILFIT